MRKLKRWWGLLRLTVTKWQTDRASRLAAALAYYTAFSLAPILVILIAIIGVFFGERTAQTEIMNQFQDIVGEDGAALILAMVRDAQEPTSSRMATLSSLVVLLVGATGMFTQLQDSLNTIWLVRPKPGRGVVQLIRDRILSFAMILGIGLVLLFAIVLSATLSGVRKWLGTDEWLWQLGHYMDLVLSFGVITFLFAMIYKVLPDVQIKWSDVWVGAVMTSVLFAVGKALLGLYLGQASFSSTYGAAGSLVVLLFWVYYSAQIFFFGAELTQVYAETYGSNILPASYAVALKAESSTPNQRD